MYKSNIYDPYSTSSDQDSDVDWDEEITCENDLLELYQRQLDAWNLERPNEKGQITKQKKNSLQECEKEKRMLVRCGHCKCKVTTQVTTTYGNLAHKLALVLFFLTCGVGVFLPYCFSSLKYITHRCPLCNAILNVNIPEHFNKCTSKIASVTVGFVAFLVAALVLFVFFVYIPTDTAALDERCASEDAVWILKLFCI